MILLSYVSQFENVYTFKILKLRIHLNRNMFIGTTLNGYFEVRYRILSSGKQFVCTHGKRG